MESNAFSNWLRNNAMPVLTTTVVVLGLPAAIALSWTSMGFSPIANHKYVSEQIQPIKDLLITKYIRDNEQKWQQIDDQIFNWELQINQSKDLSFEQRQQLERRVRDAKRQQTTIENENRNLRRCNLLLCPPRSSAGVPISQ
jgi:hypothetical protein